MKNYENSDALSKIRECFPNATLDFVLDTDEVNLKLYESYEEIACDIRKLRLSTLEDSILIVDGKEHYKIGEGTVLGSLLVAVFDSYNSNVSKIMFMGVV